MYHSRSALARKSVGLWEIAAAATIHLALDVHEDMAD
jgi:hypothetical protein